MDYKLESWMQNGMDRVDGVDLKPSLFQKIVTELKHIRILDLPYFLLSESMHYGITLKKALHCLQRYEQRRA